MTSRLARFSRFLGTVAGTVILLASGQAFASTVVVAPARVYVAPTKVVVVTAPRVIVKPAVVVKPAPKPVYVAAAPLPTVVVKPAPHNVYVASRPVYIVR